MELKLNQIKFDKKDFVEDIHLKKWLSKFKNTSLTHFLIFAIIFYCMTIFLSLLGDFLPTIYFGKDAIVQIPENAFNSSILIPSIEEAIFFGLPQYLSGHPIVVIIAGSFWSISHLFAPITESTYSLNLTAFFATIPTLLFHIRVWRSGKGWFAIVTHGGYNSLIDLGRCSAYVSQCPQFFDNNFDFPGFHIVVGLAVSLLLITYFLYRRKSKKNSKNQ